MNAQSSARESKRMQCDARVAIALPGCIMLGGGIGSLMRLARSFADDTFYSSFIANWIPWLAVAFFVAGWLVAHGIEIAVLDLRIGLTRILMISFFLLIMTLPWALSSLISNPVLEELDFLSMQLVGSGFFFRYSMFQKRTLWFLPGVSFGEKKKTEK